MQLIPNVYEKTNLDPDAVSLLVNGKVFEGWEDVQITRELNVAASDFQLKIVDKWRDDQQVWPIKSGDFVKLSVGKEVLVTGYTDKRNVSIAASQRGFGVSGRSRTGDLVDCSVVETQFSNGLNLKELAEKVCKPFGIPVIFSTDPGAVFDLVTIQQGETAFALLDRHARQRKILMHPSHAGGLVFTKAGTARAASEIREGVNLLSGSTNEDFSNRFSEYITKGQDLSFLSPGEKGTAPTGSAKDLGVSRYRPLIIIPEMTVNDGTSEDRAAYEAGMRKANSLTVEVEVQGWRMKDGNLWDINKLCQLYSGSLGVKRQMLIKKVVFNKNNSGTKTILSLVLPDAFDFSKQKKKEDPLGWAKGL